MRGLTGQSHEPPGITSVQLRITLPRFLTSRGFSQSGVSSASGRSHHFGIASNLTGSSEVGIFSRSRTSRDWSCRGGPVSIGELLPFKMRVPVEDSSLSGGLLWIVSVPVEGRAFRELLPIGL